MKKEELEMRERGAWKGSWGGEGKGGEGILIQDAAV